MWISGFIKPVSLHKKGNLGSLCHFILQLPSCILAVFQLPAFFITTSTCGCVMFLCLPEDLWTSGSFGFFFSSLIKNLLPSLCSQRYDKVCSLYCLTLSATGNVLSIYAARIWFKLTDAFTFAWSWKHFEVAGFSEWNSNLLLSSPVLYVFVKLQLPW